ncbi:AlkA N-terminal domain-containing protein [Aliiglaciecola sp. CAU 1673]|uniref:AlkA N-terminal domain-containing protein n=1 Tax=Aliiglaciecola sp. CAU 1673 TaxID=3032595 RepID=UPI0023DB0640|nr:AlkA N-terminal domain-containing protein [Aliiglaciecola sp. CAU 1673]MDF2179662.1 AlkA N-terminal domain-containing protein [Aliiglaciecola sp. CAU 1673]
MTTETHQQARLSRDRRFDGQFFIAVKTTGIFCRTICPATLPKEENVEYFPMAEQAMDAGYRPCLRCRPDSSPHSFAWKGVDTTVERALKLLREYPHLSLEQISEKLGVSDRYLRKLFNLHVGLAPKRYQLFQQLLFAKQLLHESRLNVEEVALAAGFQSARRLQDNFKQYLGLSPKQIRQVNSKHDAPLSLHLAYRPPYAWPELRQFLAARAIESMEWVTDNSYARTFRLASCEGYFIARHRPERHGFEVELELSDLSQLKAVIDEIRRVLDLDADSMLIGERLVASGVPEDKLVQGLRLPGVWHSFEAGCRAILGQQVSVTAAIKLVTQLVVALGETHSRGRLFPTPSAVAQSDLAFLKMPGSRREALQRFAAYWHAHGEPENLQDILALKGIGPWTLSYMQMRGQSHPDIWLDTDLVIKKQLNKYVVDASQIAPWRSYLTFQLWSMA